MATLSQILQRPGWLRLPLLLTVRGTPQGRVAELVYLLYHEEGEAAVITITGEAMPDEVAALFDWTTLPADVLRVLRAGAVLGTTFEAELVARLLEEPVGMVLEQLQAAADAGVPLADRGEGQFTVPPETSAALQNSTLPSLLTFWHARLGEILSGGQPADSTGLPSAVPRPPARGRRTAPAEEASGLSGDRPRAAAHLQAAGRSEAAVEHYLAAVREAVARGDTRRAYGLAEQAPARSGQAPLDGVG